MKIRFLADADLNKIIVSGLQRREPSVNFLTAQEAGLRKMPDVQVLALAHEQNRVLVSHDVGTMPKHFRALRNAGNHSAGVLLVHQSLEVGAVIEDLLLIWIASEASEWRDHLYWLPI